MSAGPRVRSAEAIRFRAESGRRAGIDRQRAWVFTHAGVFACHPEEPVSAMRTHVGALEARGRSRRARDPRVHQGQLEERVGCQLAGCFPLLSSPPRPARHYRGAPGEVQTTGLFSRGRSAPHIQMALPPVTRAARCVLSSHSRQSGAQPGGQLGDSEPLEKPVKFCTASRARLPSPHQEAGAKSSFGVVSRFGAAVAAVLAAPAREE